VLEAATLNATRNAAQVKKFQTAFAKALIGVLWGITVTVHLIHGSALALVDDNLGETGNALRACERATRQLTALSP
jgi:hypothetical protein